MLKFYTHLNLTLSKEEEYQLLLNYLKKIKFYAIIDYLDIGVKF